MECRHVSELLPWFANGSLAPEEADSVARHLDECEACRSELSETGAAFEIFGEHLPVATLVGMAFDGTTDPVSRAVAERHLESCSKCLEQLALVRRSRQAMKEVEGEGLETPARSPTAVRSGRVESVPPASGSEVSSTSWRRLALAASVAALVSSVGWLWTWQGVSGPETAGATFRGDGDPLAAGAAEDRGHVPLRERLAGAPGPELNVPIVRVEPRRGAPGGEEIVSRIPVDARGVVLVLSSRIPVDMPLACRLETADGSEVWTRRGLESRPEGGYTLRLPTDRLESGRYTLGLLTDDGVELESYLLSID